MIDQDHSLPLARQAQQLGISRGSIYYLPRAVPDADLAIMRRIEELHLLYPFAGSRMLRDLLRREGVEVPAPCRRADEADADRGALPSAEHVKASARTQSLSVPAAKAGGDAVSPMIASAVPVSRGPAMPSQKVRPVIGPAITSVAPKAAEVVRAPALPPLRRTRKIASSAPQSLPGKAVAIHNLPVVGHAPAAVRAESIISEPGLISTSSHATPVATVAPSASANVHRADPVAVPGRPMLPTLRGRARQVRSLPPPAITTAAKSIDQLYDVLSFLARLRRERQARERERREAETARKGLPSAAARPTLDPDEPVVRLRTHDPANSNRLSAMLLDHLADVALHPDWLQIEGRRIRHVGGSHLFNERWRAWRGNQEVRLVAKVHRRATGGTDDLPPAIRSQVDEAIAERRRPAAGGRPGVIDPGRGGNER